jgi:hypothetical protein
MTVLILALFDNGLEEKYLLLIFIFSYNVQ